MPPRKKEEWIEVAEAAEIVTKNSGHEVSVDYVRLLGVKGKIRRSPKNLREHLYLKGDAEKIVVRQRRKQNGAVPHEIEPQGGGEEKAA